MGEYDADIAYAKSLDAKRTGKTSVNPYAADIAYAKSLDSKKSKSADSGIRFKTSGPQQELRYFYEGHPAWQDDQEKMTQEAINEYPHWNPDAIRASLNNIYGKPKAKPAKSTSVSPSWVSAVKDSDKEAVKRSLDMNTPVVQKKKKNDSRSAASRIGKNLLNASASAPSMTDYAQNLANRADVSNGVGQDTRTQMAKQFLPETVGNVPSPMLDDMLRHEESKRNLLGLIGMIRENAMIPAEMINNATGFIGDAAKQAVLSDPSLSALNQVNPSFVGNIAGGAQKGAEFLPYFTPAGPALAGAQLMGMAANPQAVVPMVKEAVQRPINIARDIKSGRAPQLSEVIQTAGDIGMLVGAGLHIKGALKGKLTPEVVKAAKDIESGAVTPENVKLVTDVASSKEFNDAVRSVKKSHAEFTEKANVLQDKLSNAAEKLKVQKSIPEAKPVQNLGTSEQVPTIRTPKEVIPGSAQLESQMGNVKDTAKIKEAVPYDQIISKSGRRLSPFPQTKTNSERGIKNTLKADDAWLLKEAGLEAESTNNEYIGNLIRGMNQNKLSTADRYVLNDILFGDPEGIRISWENALSPKQLAKQTEAKTDIVGLPEEITAKHAPKTPQSAQNSGIPAEIPANSAEKQPWEMTKDEFTNPPSEYDQLKAIFGNRNYKSKGDYSNLSPEEAIAVKNIEHTAKLDQDMWDSASQDIKKELIKRYPDDAQRIKNSSPIRSEENHKLLVDKALSEGKSVPAEVLADYPDLAAKYSKEVISSGEVQGQARRPEEVVNNAASNNKTNQNTEISHYAGNEVFPPIEPEQFGTRKAHTTLEREAEGLEPVVKKSLGSMQEIYDNTVNKVDSGDINPYAIADSVIAGKRTLSHEDIAALGYEGIKIKNQIRELRTLPDSVESDAKIEESIASLDKITEALDKGGTGQAVAFNMRKLILNEDMSIDALMSNARRAARKEGRTLSQQEIDSIKAEHEEYLRLEQAVKDAEARELASKKEIERLKTDLPSEPVIKLSKRIIDQLTDVENSQKQWFKEHMGQLHEGVSFTGEALTRATIWGAIKFAKGAVKFADWSAEMIKDLGEGIKPHLESIWKSASDKFEETLSSEIDALKPLAEAKNKLSKLNSKSPKTTSEAKKLELAKARARKQISILEQHIADKTALPPKSKLKADEELKQLYRKVKALTIQHRKLMGEESKSPNKPKQKAKVDKLQTAINTAKRRIAILEKYNAEQKPVPKSTPIKANEELNNLRSEIKRLTKINNKYKDKTSTKAQANNTRIKAMEERIKLLEKHIAEGTPLPQKKAVKATGKLAVLQEQSRKLKEKLNEIVSMNEPDTIRESRIRAKQLRNAQAQLNSINAKINRLKRGEVLPTDKGLVEPDIETLKARALLKVQKAKLLSMTNSQPEMSTWDKIVEIGNVPRTLKTMADFGHLFRQGGKLFIGENKSWRSAANKSIKAMFSGENAMVSQEMRQQNPEYAFAKAVGLWEAPLDYVKDVGMKEEIYAGAGPLKRIPVLRSMIGGGERSYTEFGNTLRFDTFYKYKQIFGDSMSQEGYEHLAAFLNKATGRGNLGGLEHSAAALSSFFFAPRYKLAQLQAPMYIFDYKHPEVAKIAAKNYAGYIGAGITFLCLVKGAAQLSGQKAEIHLDPRDKDFGRAVVGKQRLDIWGPEASNTRNIARFLMGQSISNGKVRKLDYSSWAGNLIRYNLAPAPGTTWSLIERKNAVGEDYSPSNWKFILEQEALPMFANDVIDAWREEGWERGMLTAPMALVGVTTQTYDDNSKGPKIPINIPINIPIK